MSVLHTQTAVVARNCVLRFPMDSDPDTVHATLMAWNLRFKEYFPGTGYFTEEPEIEMYSEGDEIVACNAHYLYADTQLWKAIQRSRTLTVDEPVLAAAAA
jgi:hypothetical protein